MGDWAPLGHLDTRSQPISVFSIPHHLSRPGSSCVIFLRWKRPLHVGAPTRRVSTFLTLNVFAQLVAQLLSFPLGCAWARTVPGVRILGVSLNPGPFSLKEHVVITIMATMGSSSAYAVRLLLFGRGDPILPVALVLISDCMGACVPGTTDRHYRGAKKMVRPELVLCVPVAPRHVYATHRLLHGRSRQTIPCFPTFYESVYLVSLWV